MTRKRLAPANGRCVSQFWQGYDWPWPPFPKSALDMRIGRRPAILDPPSLERDRHTQTQNTQSLARLSSKCTVWRDSTFTRGRFIFLGGQIRAAIEDEGDEKKAMGALAPPDRQPSLNTVKPCRPPNYVFFFFVDRTLVLDTWYLVTLRTLHVLDRRVSTGLDSFLCA